MFSGLVARAPIYTRSLDLFGYELRWCSGDALQQGAVDDDAQFGESLLRLSRELSLDDLTGGGRALVRMPPQALPICEELGWPRERLVLALPEAVLADRDVAHSVGHLAAKGYTIALHNPSRDLAEFSRQIEFVSMCALDADARTDISVSSQLRERPQLLVRELETADQYEHFRERGFDYYEGAYFTRPRLMHGTEIPANRLSVLQLLARLRDPNVDVREVEQLVSRDITLSYKLLRLINAAYFGVPRRVDSIRRAVVFFGLERIKNWASVILVSAIEFRPRELLVMAMIRARGCELLAQELGRSPVETYYVAGLFSLLDAIMDAPMAAILERLNLTEELNLALLSGTGPVGEVLRCMLAFERADALAVPFRRFSQEDFPLRTYLDSIRWAGEATRQIAAP